MHLGTPEPKTYRIAVVGLVPRCFQSSTVGTADGQLAKITPSGRFPHFLKVQFPEDLA